MPFEKKTKEFQSHIGAIRILNRLGEAGRGSAYFNPTLVQLEFFFFALSAAALAYFNPTLVQLEFSKLHQLRSERLISIPHWCN